MKSEPEFAKFDLPAKLKSPFSAKSHHWDPNKWTNQLHCSDYQKFESALETRFPGKVRFCSFWPLQVEADDFLFLLMSSNLNLDKFSLADLLSLKFFYVFWFPFLLFVLKHIQNAIQSQFQAWTVDVQALEKMWQKYGSVLSMCLGNAFPKSKPENAQFFEADRCRL